MLDNDSLCVAVAEEDSEEAVGGSGLDKGEGVHTVDLFATSTTIVGCLLPVGPHGINTLSKSEFSLPLTKAIYLLSRQFHVHLNELVLHDEGLILGVN